MPQKIHGHAVLHILLSSPRPMTRTELQATADREFGPGALYHTCSAEGMDLDGLLSFLLVRGKVTETEGCLVAHRDQMCDHE